MSNSSEDRVKKYQQHCIYFNGTQNHCCRAGIVYNDLTKGGQAIPCIPLPANQATCSEKTLYTEAEAIDRVNRQNKALIERADFLNTGRCPICKVEVKQRQIGLCVYGTCGHRLYQGKVNPKFVV